MEDTREYFTRNRKYYWENLKNECINCGSTDELQLHHIVPLSQGGTNRLSNIVVICSKCHGKIHGIGYKNHSANTKKGIEKARLNGKQIGQPKGTKLTTKKSIKAKEDIKKYSKDFNGSLTDVDVMKLIGVARNTYYKYKKEIVEGN